MKRKFKYFAELDHRDNCAKLFAKHVKRTHRLIFICNTTFSYFFFIHLLLEDCTRACMRCTAEQMKNMSDAICNSSSRFLFVFIRVMFEHLFAAEDN